MKLIYNPSDKPKFGQNVVFAIQQILAIMAATIAVPLIVGNGMSIAAAMFGAGVGTIVYLLFTKFKSPVFLGSSFAFLGPMAAAFAGASSMALGYIGLILGAVFAGLVYVILAIIVKLVGVNWINKLMPAAIIGPTVAIIGLSLAGSAVGDMTKGKVLENGASVANPLIAFVVAFITLAVIVICSTYGKKTAKLFPFIIGILAGYAVALIFTLIGMAAGIKAFRIIDFAPFEELVKDGVTLSTFVKVPDFTFVTAKEGLADFDVSYLISIAFAYVPVAFVVFAEHIADHKNLSSIIEKDLLKEPGLSRTLLGDGVGSMAGALFGGCPNTTYGESVGCVAITGNASTWTILFAAIGAIIISFISPFVALVNSIPNCVMGGMCVTLYGFIAVSGLKMVQKVDLENNRNLFVVSTILITGIGGLTLNFGTKADGSPLITITSIAMALILGIIVNWILSGKKDN